MPRHRRSCLAQSFLVTPNHLCALQYNGVDATLAATALMNPVTELPPPAWGTQPEVSLSACHWDENLSGEVLGEQDACMPSPHGLDSSVSSAPQQASAEPVKPQEQTSLAAESATPDRAAAASGPSDTAVQMTQTQAPLAVKSTAQAADDSLEAMGSHIESPTSPRTGARLRETDRIAPAASFQAIGCAQGLAASPASGESAKAAAQTPDERYTCSALDLTPAQPSRSVFTIITP